MSTPIDRREFLKGAAGVGGALIGAAAGAALPGAAGATTRTAARSSAERRPLALAANQTATFSISNLPASVDPMVELGGSPRRLDIYEALVDVTPSTGAPLPFLATSWKLVNPTTVRFKLRPGVRFQNGDPFTADDVVFSFTRASTAGYATQSILDSYKAAKAVDPLTVDIELTHPDALIVKKVARIAILPKHYYLGLGSNQKARDTAFALKPIGTGPYRCVSYTPEKAVVAVNRKYTWRKPTLTQVTMLQDYDTATQVSALLSGAAQYANIMPLSALGALRGAGMRLLPIRRGNDLGAFIDTVTMTGAPKPGPMGNKMVRQAINYGIDKKTLVRSVLQNETITDHGQLASQGETGYDSSLHDYAYDPAKANQMLDAAGYHKRSDGTRFSVTMATAFAGPGSVRLVMGEYLQNQISKLGIAVQYAALTDVSTAIAYFYGTKTRPDIYHFGLFNRPYMDPAGALNWFTSNNPTHHFANRSFDTAYLASEKELNGVKRASLLHACSTIFREECPWLFATEDVWIDAASPKLQGVIISEAETEQYFDRLRLLA